MRNLIDLHAVLQDVSRFNSDNAHGLSTMNCKEILGLIESVSLNDTENKTEFPDFIGEYGFIESFHVTACGQDEQNESGYKLAKCESSIIKGILDSDSYDKSVCFVRDKDSLDDFRMSFEAAWAKHIKHLQKYNGRKHVSCFLVTSDDMFFVHNIYDSDIYYGDLSKSERAKFCLAYDMELLNYMYEYHDDVDYVIYYNLNSKYVEIIKLSNIPLLKRYMFSQKYKISTSFSVEYFD